MKDRDILKIVRLVRFLDTSKADKKAKANEIKFARDMGIITDNEAIELTVEYC